MKHWKRSVSGEIRREEPVMRDRKRITLKRPERRKTKRIRQLLLIIVIVRAEVVKATQTKSPPHAPESPALLTCARVRHDSAVHPNFHR